MNSITMKKKPTIKNRTRQRQRQRFRLVVAAASVLTVFTTVLILYFQLFKREEIKAQDITITDDALPVKTTLEKAVIAPADTNQRNGVRFKIAIPIERTIR